LAQISGARWNLRACLKCKFQINSCDAAELNADHGQMNPRLGGGIGAFVIAHQSAMAHEPAKGVLNTPPMWQYNKVAGFVRTPDYFDLQLGPEVAHPLGKIVAAVAAVHPELSQPFKPVAHPLKYLLRPVAFRAACQGDNPCSRVS